MNKMNLNPSCSLSSDLVSYLTGDFSESEMNKMEKHLLDCPSCSMELKELQEAWLMIPNKIEQVDVPFGLKEEVMNAIFQSENHPQETIIGPIKGFEEVPRISYLRPVISFVVAAALLLTFGVLIWNNILLRGEVAQLKNQSQSPIKVSKVFTLKSDNPSQGSAEGSALLYQQGDKQELAFQLHGLAETKGSETYQVWLIHNGTRKSCGVFQVDKHGNGFLTYELDQKDRSFDAIGVSLEPDSNSTQPRGKNILGT